MPVLRRRSLGGDDRASAERTQQIASESSDLEEAVTERFRTLEDGRAALEASWTIETPRAKTPLPLGAESLPTTPIGTSNQENQGFQFSSSGLESAARLGIAIFLILEVGHQFFSGCHDMHFVMQLMSIWMLVRMRLDSGRKKARQQHFVASSARR
jgi:hypothetical protein